MVGDPGDTKGFGVLGNPSEGDYASARNVFAVITDPTAAKSFISTPTKRSCTTSRSTTDWIKNGDGPDSRISAAGHAGAPNGSSIRRRSVAQHRNYGIAGRPSRRPSARSPGSCRSSGTLASRLSSTALLSNGPRVPTESFGEVYNLEKFTVANAAAVHPLRTGTARPSTLHGPERRPPGAGAVPQAERVKHYDALSPTRTRARGQ